MTQKKTAQRSVRRYKFLQAYDVLRGQQLHPLEMQAQFLEMQVSYEGMLNKLSLALTRLAKREQRDVNRAIEAIAPASENGQESPTIGPDAGYPESKDALRRRVFLTGSFVGGSQRQQGE